MENEMKIKIETAGNEELIEMLVDINESIRALVYEMKMLNSRGVN